MIGPPALPPPVYFPFAFSPISTGRRVASDQFWFCSSIRPNSSRARNTTASTKPATDCPCMAALIARKTRRGDDPAGLIRCIERFRDSNHRDIVGFRLGRVGHGSSPARGEARRGVPSAPASIGGNQMWSASIRKWSAIVAASAARPINSKILLDRRVLASGLYVRSPA